MRVWVFCAMVWPWIASAQDAPRVVTDIAPVHSLTARVMAGVAAPDLLMPPGSDPHSYALRPSDARALEAADLVIWVGAALTPQLAGPIGTLGGAAPTVELMQAEGWTPRRYPDAGSEEDHDEEGAHEGDDGHGDHVEHDDHETAADHGAHGHSDAADHDEDDHAAHQHHGAEDPHGWLDPVAAQAWTRAIAVALSEIDPANAARYAANAAALNEELVALDAEIAAGFADALPRYIAPHDAMGYFAERYGVAAVGQLAASDAQAPGPARLQALAGLAQTGAAVCVLHRPGFPRYAQTVAGSSEAKVMALDLTGETIPPGPALYPALLRQVADVLRMCR